MIRANHRGLIVIYPTKKIRGKVVHKMQNVNYIEPNGFNFI